MNDNTVGFREIDGVEETGVADVVVGVTSSFKPGIDFESCLIPRPPVALVPNVDEPAAAIPERLEELDNVDVVGLERAPNGTRDVVAVLVGRVGAA